MSIFKDHVMYVTKTLGLPYYYILGNHDFYKPNDSKYHALQALEDIHNFNVVSKRQDINNMWNSKLQKEEKVSITMLPYYYNQQEFPRECNEITICHQTFRGADFGFICDKDGVDARDIKTNIIISGHIHKKQQLADGKVVYPGSPYAQSANDVNEVKGLLLFDTNNYNQKFIECPLPKWRKLEYIIGGDINSVTINEHLQTHLNDTDHWVVEITGPKSEIISYLGSDSFKTTTLAKDIKIKTKFTDKDKERIKISSNSMESILEEYMGKVYKGTVSPEKIKKAALIVLERARTIS